jgi:hypothetical protein
MGEHRNGLLSDGIGLLAVLVMGAAGTCTIAALFWR